MKRFLSIFFIFFFAQLVFCEDLTIAEYIESAKNDPRITSKKTLSDSFESSGNTPWVKSLEFRSETGNFDILEQTYALRLYFRGFGETKATREFMKNSQNIYRLECKSARSEILLERYSAIVYYIHHKKELKLIDSMQELLEDKLSVTEKIGAMTAETTEIDKMDIEDKITDFEMKKIELESTVESIENTVQSDMNSEKKPAFDKEKIISIDEIEEFADSLGEISGAAKAESDLQALRAIIAQNEIALEEAKERNWLKYIALEYDTGDRADKPSHGFSIGFAISIPGFKNNQTSILKKHLKSLEETSEFDTQNRIKKAEIRSALIMLKREIRQYRVLAERKKKVEKSDIMSKYSSIEGVNPLMIIKLKERILKKELKMAELELKIYERYINLAYLSGMYEEENGRNFLYGKTE